MNRNVIVYLTVLLLLMGVTQAVTEQEVRQNQIVVDDFKSLETDVRDSFDTKSIEYSETLLVEEVKIKGSDNFKVFLIAFCLCFFLIPTIFNNVRLKLNEKRIKFYNDNRSALGK